MYFLANQSNNHSVNQSMNQSINNQSFTNYSLCNLLQVVDKDVPMTANVCYKHRRCPNFGDYCCLCMYVCMSVHVGLCVCMCVCIWKSSDMYVVSSDRCGNGTISWRLFQDLFMAHSCYVQFYMTVMPTYLPCICYANQLINKGSI